MELVHLIQGDVYGIQQDAPVVRSDGLRGLCSRVPSFANMVISWGLDKISGSVGLWVFTQTVSADCKSPICADPKFLTLGLSLKVRRAALLAGSNRAGSGARMYGWEPLRLLKHYLDQSISKAELSRRFGVNRRTLNYWIERDS